MTETHQTQTLVATLHEALQKIDSALGRTREGVDAIGQEAGGCGRASSRWAPYSGGRTPRSGPTW